MLEIKDLKSGYGKKEILKGISLDVKEKEIVAIIGPNGSGKSTLLKSIFNLCDIYSGKIILNNKEITKKPTDQLILHGISYVPQGRQVFPTLTVKENLEMGGFVIKDKKRLKKRINELFKEFPILKEKQKERALTLSGGQQQILAIARALVQDPKLILLDEPSLGLSPLAMKEVFDKVIDINKKGITVMVVEQNTKQAAKIAHRIFVLEAGKIALESKKLIKKEIRKIYFGT
jgi:branched-chain amino acid transport system ATP-binding protein